MKTNQRPVKPVNELNTTPLNATFTKWNGEWMIRLNRRITASDGRMVERECFDGTQTEVRITTVDVSKKDGTTKAVEIGEYEKRLADDAHIYSVGWINSGLAAR